MHSFSNSCEDAQPLPEHWEMRIDPRTGLPYYLNHQGKFTTWDDPRVVEQPRGMINSLGSMLRPNSPQRARQSSVEPCSSSDRFFTTPSSMDYFTHSLPKRRNHHQSQSFFKRPFMNDWVHEELGQLGSDFGGPSWPFKSHTIQRERPARAQSVQPTRTIFVPRQSNFDDEVDYRQVPVNSSRADPRYQGEHYIIPTQYKKKNGSMQKTDEKQQQQQQCAPERSQHNQRQQEHICDDSNEDAILQRMNSNQQNFDNDESQDVQDLRNNNANQPMQSSPIKIVVEDHDSQNIDETSHVNDKEQPSSDDQPETNGQTDKDESEVTNEDENKTAIAASYKAIEKIREEVDGYKSEVEKFTGEKTSKDYRYLDEMLTRCQLGLDNVETHGDVDLRKTRKQTVNYIESILRALEDKVKS